MLCRKLLLNAKRLGCATKITFAQGHGYSRQEIMLMEKERQGKVKRLRSQVEDEWHIPNHILAGQAFSYETELFSFTRRVGCNSSYVSEQNRLAGQESLLSSAFVVILSHQSSCNNPEIINLKKEICEIGRSQLSWYLMNYFASVFPNITSELLYKLSVPEMCLSSAKCYSMYKQLCLHELIRTKSDDSLTLEDYSDSTGGIFLAILLFDEQPYLSAPKFLQACILNYYSQLDFRNVIDYDDITVSEKKLKEYLASKGGGNPEIRVISIDGEDSPVPLYNIGIFIDNECIATAADRSVEGATLHACNAALTRFIFSERNENASVNTIDFSTLTDEVVTKGREIEQKLRDVLNGVNLAEYEIENKFNLSVVTNSGDYDRFKPILGLRHMKYETNDQ